MIASFYIASGPDNIEGTLSFMGIPGGLSCHNICYHNTDDLTSKVMEECQEIIKEGFQQEVVESVKDILKYKYTEEEIDIHTRQFFNKSSNIPDEIK